MVADWFGFECGDIFKERYMIKHIVQIIPALGYGGAERMVIDLINNSDSTKYRFTVIVFFDNLPLKALIKNKTEVILVEKKSKYDIGFLNRLENKLAELKPDLIHGHLFAGDFWGRLAAHHLNVPFLSTEHNLNYEDGWFKNYIKRIISTKQDYYVACSLAVSDYMRDVYKISSDIAVINNGIDLNRFINLPPAIFQEPLKFLMVGRLVKQKGHLVVLKALNNLKSFSWSLIIVGSGEEKNNLLEFVKTNNLGERVLFIDPTTQIEKLYSEADILLMPSIWEGLGVVVMEAMASGRLVVASKTGGLIEIIRNNETGYFGASNNVLNWEEKIRYFFENKKNIQTVVKSAKVYAQENFGIDKMTDKYNKVYSMIIK